MGKEANKKMGQELQEFLAWRKKGSAVPPKKGKGSYDRKSFNKGS